MVPYIWDSEPFILILGKSHSLNSYPWLHKLDTRYNKYHNINVIMNISYSIPTSNPEFAQQFHIIIQQL